MGEEHKGKPKYYLWRTNTEAGITENYLECQRNFLGKPGGRCVKKFTSRVEAEKELNPVLEEIRKLKDNDQDDNVQNPTGEDPSAGHAAGHDDHYEEFVNFKKEVTDFMCTVEQQVSDILIENRELLVDINDIECRMKNNIQDLKITIDQKMTDLISDFESQLKSHKADISRNNSRLNKELRKLNESNSKLESTLQSSKRNSTTEFELEVTTHQTTESTEQAADPPTNAETREDDDTRNTVPINRSTPARGHTDTQEQLTPNDSNPILILSDSTLRGIIQSRFVPTRYTNKQYIQGGPEEMINHIKSIQDTTNYGLIIFHTVT